MTLLGELERNRGQSPISEDNSRGVLRFITCGSVDDGKSTLIGRLLHDTRAILEDQLAAVARASSKRGQGDLDLSLLTDGLEAEREQGITIDVAYRYFTTGRRKFIIADTPGHEQYTRNMVTGASTAGAAVILLDARKGLLPQSRRHLYLAHLLGIRDVIVAVNKLDLIGYASGIFDALRAEFERFAESLNIPNLRFVPISALRGDMLVGLVRAPRAARAFEAKLCWLANEPLAPQGRYLLKHTTRNVKAKFASIDYRVDVQTLGRKPLDGEIRMNDIVHAALVVQQPVFVDSYAMDRATGAFILVDETNNQTVAAGMIE